MSIEKRLQKAIEEAQDELYRQTTGFRRVNRRRIEGKIQGLKKALKIVQEHRTPKPIEPRVILAEVKIKDIEDLKEDG